MAQLQSGDYVISSILDHHFVGCYEPEGEGEGETKQVFALLPAEVLPKWHVNKNDEGYYLQPASTNINTSGIQVSGSDLVTTIPYGQKGPGTDPESWVITPVPNEGQEVYTVETNDRNRRWVVDREGELNQRGAPITVKSRKRSVEETYHPNQLFTFTRLNKD